MNEITLAERARKGSKDAFCGLYGLYKDRYYRYALYRLGDPREAEEAVSECALALWQQIGKLREPAAFAAWSFKILSRCCMKQIQGRRKDVSLTAVPEPSEAPGTETRLMLEEALATLTEQERDIVLWSVVAGLNSTEIGELTGMAPGSVRSSLSRSLKKLRQYWVR